MNDGSEGATAVAENPAETNGETKKRRSRAKVERSAYRAEGAGKLAALPTDWDSKKHLPLGKSDFADEAVFFDWKAEQAQRQANRFAKLARECREGGTEEQRKAKKKFAKMRDQMEAMQQELIATLGPDAVQEFLARLAAANAGN